ncbi:MAG: hypothetical protein PQJ59_02080 [Spirochaetales bacterium]|nr:hypothetical protein [Spirochaetales bacterium]
MKKYITLLLIITFLPAATFSKDKEPEQSLFAGAQLYFESDLMESSDSDYETGVIGYLSVRPGENWEFLLQADAGSDAVRMDEIWGKYSFSDKKSLQFGIFENGILMEDGNGTYSYFTEECYIRERLDDMGWYSDNSAGGRYVREGKMLRGTGEFFFMSNSSEVLLRGDLNAPLGSGRGGATLIYHPYLFHNMWSDEKTFSLGLPEANGIYEIHYFLLDLYWGDLTEEKDWIYKAEGTIGNNLSDPIGYLGYPGGESCSGFLSGDLLLGRIMGREEFNWTPSVNVSAYMEDLEEPNIGNIIFRAGNRWRWDNRLTLFVDAGMEIKNYNQQEESGETLMTGIDGILNARAQYSF